MAAMKWAIPSFIDPSFITRVTGTLSGNGTARANRRPARHVRDRHHTPRQIVLDIGWDAVT